MNKPTTARPEADTTGARQSTNRKNARFFAQAGLYVFPSDGKIPLVPRYNRADTSLSKEERETAIDEYVEKHGVEPAHVGATKDDATLVKLWRKFPNAVPSISCGPSKLVVLDADLKDDGPRKLRMLFAERGGLPAGIAINPTKSGGEHFVFGDPEGKFSNRAGLLKKNCGTDVRGTGGQFVAPGSIREDGATYGTQADKQNFVRAVVGGKLPTLPDYIVELIGTQPDSESAPLNDSDPVVKGLIEELGVGERDGFLSLFDSTVGKFPLDYIRQCRPDFDFFYDHPSDDRSANRMKAATFLVGAYPELTVNDYAAFCEEWAGAGEYDDRQLAREFARAKLNPAHVSKPSDGSAFEPVEDEGGETGHKRPSHIRASDLVANYKPIRWLVKRLIPLNSVGALYGLPNVGKSFVVFDLASHARRGRDWFDRKIAGGDVLYCYAEGAEGMSGRAKAWADNNDTSGGDVALMNNVPNLFKDPKAADKLIAEARKCEADSGQPVRLIIVDTLAAATTGADGSSDKDMGVVCERLRKVATALDCAVLVVHHSGKDVSKGMRGSSAILGAVDYTLLAEEGKGGSTISVEKMRDASKAQSIRFKLVEVVIGKDGDGEDVTSCIIRPTTVGEGLDIAVDDREEASLIKRGDKREDRVERLIEVAGEEVARASLAEDEATNEIGLTLVRLTTLLNASRTNYATLDGKPFAPLHRKDVSRVVQSAVEAERLSVRGSKYYLR
ncbi:AAA family ATPase [Bradyrhizobium sp. 26S5]|uniref:AAA family ATPase n=1 Tax=Bradyrhizobium sp. 26S5 TaxID=3139729 RepID=UPI0030D36077